jgi:Pyruvate/2-oxoacid:ferredoxin oxidoreductase gamma subunit
MERELLMTGIGGQGIQLAARVLAEAAIADGMQVRLFGSYGGMMRGGNTDATLIFGDAPIETPPVVAEAWSAVIMHPEFAVPVWAALRADGVAMVNTSVTELPDDHPAHTIGLPATDIAIELGNVMCSSMVMAGAYGAATGIVSHGALEAGIAVAVPSYRRQHVDLNIAALAAGRDAVPEPAT